MSQGKFVVVDASSMLSTCYYAVLPKEIMFAKTEEEKERHYGKILHAKDGTYTNAIFGMLKMVVSLMSRQKPSHIAFVFDRTRDTFRRELYKDYKGTRGVTPKPLSSQFELMERILADVGFQVLLSRQFEADDYAGSLVMKFRREIPMIVMTKDHDYLQLVNDEYNVRAWMVQTRQEKAEELYQKYGSFYGGSGGFSNLPEKVFEYTAGIVLSEEGVKPEQIPDLKGIQGDSSDNIPGVKGVSSAAAPLLREYKTVEGLYRAIHEAQGSKEGLKELADFWKNQLKISRSPYKALTKTNLENPEELCGEQAALLSKTLATMKTDIPIDLELKDFSAKAYDGEKVKKWLKELDIKEASIFGKSMSL